MVGGHGGLRIVHDVGHGSVLVAEEVFDNVNGALIEIDEMGGLIATLLVGVDAPVNAVKEAVLKPDEALTLGVEVERHMLVTLDAHECTVNSEKRVQKGALLDVSPETFNVPVSH